MDFLEDQTTVARAAGATALILAAVFVLSIFIGPGNVIHNEPDSATALAFARSHGTAIKLLGFADGTINTLFGILIVLLIALARADGVLARIAYLSAGAAAAIQWTHTGVLYALSELAHRGGADQGVLALLSLGATMDDADGIVIPIAMFCAGWLLLSSHRVPAAFAWVTIAAAAIGTFPSFVLAVGGPDLGPVSVVSAWIWLLVIGIGLIVKPLTGGREVRATSAAV